VLIAYGERHEDRNAQCQLKHCKVETLESSQGLLVKTDQRQAQVRLIKADEIATVDLHHPLSGKDLLQYSIVMRVKAPMMKCAGPFSCVGGHHHLKH